MALPDTLLGTSLKAYFDQGYTFGTGTLVDAKATAANLAEATSGDRPTWDTTSAPSGRGLLSFAGRPGTQRLDGGQIPTGALPAWGGFWIEFFVFKRGTAVATLDDEKIIDYDGWDNASLTYGKLYRLNSFSDNPGITNTDVHRAVVVTNAATNLSTVHIDNVAQGDPGSTSAGAGGQRVQWVGNKFVGNRNNKSVPFNGLIGCIGYAQQATWTSGDTAALDAAMAEWWTTPAGGGGSDVVLTLSAAQAEERRAALSSLSLFGSALPAPRSEQRHAALVAVAANLVAVPRGASEERRAPTSILASYAAALPTPAREERRPSATALGVYGIALAGVGSRDIVPPPSSEASNPLALASASPVGGLPPLAVSPGPISIALAAVFNQERPGTVSVLFGGSAPQGILFAATAPAEARATVAATASYLAVLPAAAPGERTVPPTFVAYNAVAISVATAEERRAAITTLTALTAAVAPAPSDLGAPAALGVASYGVALAATTTEQRATSIATSATLVAQLSAPPAEERRFAVAQRSAYMIALAAPTATQATSFVRAGDYVTISCEIAPAAGPFAPTAPAPSAIPFVIRASENARSFVIVLTPSSSVVVLTSPSSVIEVG